MNKKELTRRLLFEAGLREGLGKRREPAVIQDSSPRAEDIGRKKLVVTKKDVLAFDNLNKKNRQWILPEDAIITSLAKDTARQRGILLKNEYFTGEE
ncbi:MAG: hypothetical protein LBJ22_05565 [Synergistaceae bacterium]|jgi:Flp pilus assembly protein CpaB|nr:hypothetical protein [Synergistaceae bacterium]